MVGVDKAPRTKRRAPAKSTQEIVTTCDCSEAVISCPRCMKATRIPRAGVVRASYASFAPSRLLCAQFIRGLKESAWDPQLKGAGANHRANRAPNPDCDIFHESPSATL